MKLPSLRSSCDWSPCNQCSAGEILHFGESESSSAFEYPYFSEEDDQIDDYPQKRRQRRRKLHNLHCYAARTGAAGIAASASLLTQQVENTARVEGANRVGTSGTAVVASVTESLASVLDSSAGRVVDLASSLAGAIGHPPLHTSVREDVALHWLCAINFYALCSLAALCLFISSFFGDICRADGHQLQDVGLRVDEATRIQSIARVFGVIVLSLISGCALGLRHPIQSALIFSF
mmetsp:Transcript_2970/g.4999  ORF Transcript_2970/g.4999 Transcript_2970/m.4999 type:complete len:235 (-) Transcript_2970:76-780(-)